MIRFLLGIIFDLILLIIRLIGKLTFLRINKKDEIYLENYYKRLAGIDGDIEFARKQTELERKKVILMKESRLWERLSNLFG